MTEHELLGWALAGVKRARVTCFNVMREHRGSAPEIIRALAEQDEGLIAKQAEIESRIAELEGRAEEWQACLKP